jgi:hypothetical protein
LFLFILDNGKQIQKTAKNLEIIFKEIDKVYSDKFISIVANKIIRLNWPIKILIKEIVQNSKNNSNVVIKLIFKNKYLY